MNNTITQYNNTKHSKYKYTCYQNTHTIVKTPPKLQSKLQQPQYKLHTKWNSHNKNYQLSKTEGHWRTVFH